MDANTVGIGADAYVQAPPESCRVIIFADTASLGGPQEVFVCGGELTKPCSLAYPACLPSPQ
jgi:hypothetical protein